MASPDELIIRRAEPSDDSAIIELASSALGWKADEPNEALFRWKHRANPFGTSPMWVAVDDGELVGFRAMMRWRFRSAAGTTAEAARAVDTATRPTHQGQGIFRRLTMQAIDEMRASGIDFVFNTPNAQSRPGYLKMGWTEVGRPTIHAQPRGISRLPALAGARTAAGKWSLPSGAGVDARDALADREAVAHLLEQRSPSAALRTDHDAASMAWRYGLAQLRYRAIMTGDTVADGVALVRTRPRGSAVEATVADILIPASASLRPLLKKLRRELDADYLLAADHRLVRHGFVPVPGQGPALTTRDVSTSGPGLDAFDFALGDLELF